MLPLLTLARLWFNFVGTRDALIALSRAFFSDVSSLGVPTTTLTSPDVLTWGFTRLNKVMDLLGIGRQLQQPSHERRKMRASLFERPTDILSMFYRRRVSHRCVGPLSQSRVLN